MSHDATGLLATTKSLKLLGALMREVHKCTHKLTCHHHASWDPVPGTNILDQPCSQCLSRAMGPDVHSITITNMPFSSSTLACQPCHFHLSILINPCYPQDPHLPLIHPSHPLPIYNFITIFSVHLLSTCFSIVSSLLSSQFQTLGEAWDLHFLCGVQQLDGDIFSPMFHWCITNLDLYVLQSWKNGTFRTRNFHFVHFHTLGEFIKFILDAMAFTLEMRGSTTPVIRKMRTHLCSLTSQSMPVKIKRLTLEPSQVKAIEHIYSEHYEVTLRFLETAHDQKDVQDFLTSHLLNHTSWQNLESWWNIQWSNSWPVGKSEDWQCRSLFQW